MKTVERLLKSESADDLIEAAKVAIKIRAASWHMNGEYFSSTEAVKTYLKFYYQKIVFEQMDCMFLNGHNRLIAHECVGTGDLEGVHMYSRVVVKRAIELDALRVLISHNHPSGDARASISDISSTLAFKKACDILEIELMDHMIVGNGSSDIYSFVESGIIK